MLRATAAALLSAAALLTGCASEPSSALAGAKVPADRYAATFQAARDVVRSLRFTADRVDAPQGVLTTLPRSSPGLFKPWETSSGGAAAWDDTLNYQMRTVQVVFLTAEAPGRTEGGRIIPPANPDRDLALMPQDTTMLVRVAVDRIERDGRRVSADSVRIERQTADPNLAQAGEWPRYLVQEPDDTVLAAELLRRILARAEASPARPAAAQTEAGTQPTAP